MPKTLKLAGDDVLGVLNECRTRFHPELETARFAVVLVDPPRDADNMPTGDAVSVHGRPAAAKLKLCSPLERLLKVDVIMQIDAVWWSRATHAQRLALLDQQLEHLQTTTLRDGSKDVNADCSLKLTLRPADWYLSGFYAVAERNREEALEVIGLRKLFTGHQQLFVFATPPFDAPAVAPVPLEQVPAVQIRALKRSVPRSVTFSNGDQEVTLTR